MEKEGRKESTCQKSRRAPLLKVAVERNEVVRRILAEVKKRHTKKGTLKNTDKTGTKIEKRCGGERRKERKEH